MKKEWKYLAVIGMVLVSFYLGFAIGQDKGVEAGRTIYEGKLLPVALERNYRGIVVLAPLGWKIPTGSLRFYGEPDMLAADGKPIEAGKRYQPGSGLTGRGVRPIVEISAPEKK